MSRPRVKLYNEEGEPIHVRLYDVGPECLDRWTAVFTLSRIWCGDGSRDYFIGLSNDGSSFYQHGESEKEGGGQPYYGRRVPWKKAPEAVRKAVKVEYRDNWQKYVIEVLTELLGAPRAEAAWEGQAAL